MTSLRATLVAIIIVFNLAPASVVAADTCQGLFRVSGPLLDLRYGRASQNDPYLETEGLIHSSGSQLCGPTCLFNGLAKFHRIEGRDVYAEGPRRIADLVRQLFPLTGFDVVSKGARPQDLAHVMRSALREEKIDAAIQLYSSVESSSQFTNPIIGRPSLELLHQSILDDTIVIAEIGRYGVTDPNDARENLRFDGHYVIVAGYNPDIPSQIIVIDPNSPRQLRIVDLELIHPERFPARAFQARYVDSGDTQSVRLIEALIVVKRRQPIH